MDIRQVMDAGRVIRYHTHPMIGHQNIAEHSWGVAQVLLAVWPNCRQELLVAALNHDVIELKTGDIPATAKWDCQELEEALGVAEDRQRALLGIRCHKEGLTPFEVKLLKLADMVELSLHSLHQLALGNTRAAVLVRTGLRVSRDRCDALTNSASANETAALLLMSNIITNIFDDFTRLEGSRHGYR